MNERDHSKRMDAMGQTALTLRQEAEKNGRQMTHTEALKRVQQGVTRSERKKKE